MASLVRERCSFILIVALLASPVAPVLASDHTPANVQVDLAKQTLESHQKDDEPRNGGWELHLDNDAFAPAGQDGDYTGGIALSLMGRRAQEYPFSLDRMRNGIDSFLGHDRIYSDHREIERHSMEFGLVAYTPRDTSNPNPINNDRPYASLLFLANSYKAVDPEQLVAFHSTLSVGLLGLGLADELQKSIHTALGQGDAAGWAHQISAGGEPTVRYSFTRQQLRSQGVLKSGERYEFNRMISGSVGTLTDLGMGLYVRAGNIRSPWWAINPWLAEGMHVGTSALNSKGRSSRGEAYVWAGIDARFRIYNALLQGQFRESRVTYTYDELHPLVLGTWIGHTLKFPNGLSINFTLRTSTPELRVGEQRIPIWGSITINIAT